MLSPFFSGGSMRTKDFPKADLYAARDFYDLGRAKLTHLSTLSPAALHQSVALALLSFQTGHGLLILQQRTHLCGPKRRTRNLVKKR
jgi:hypothetical protein